MDDGTTCHILGARHQTIGSHRPNLPAAKKTLKMPTRDYSPLFTWRTKHLGSVTAERLVYILTVEALPYYNVPGPLIPLLVQFRHLRMDARVAVAKRWLETSSFGAN
jgi:hypothetical protein